MHPSRRQLLVGAAALTASCTTDRGPRPAQPNPDVALVTAAVVREQQLIDAYLAALREHPSLTELLAPMLGDHAAHLAALRDDDPPSPATSGPASSREPRRRPQVLRDLATLEREAATAHAAAAEQVEQRITCSTRVLAPLFASLAACEASHVALL